MSRNPVVVPVAALLAGAELALRSGLRWPLLAAALLGAGLALRDRRGAAVCGLALGLLTVWARPAPALSAFGAAAVDLGRPLTVEGTLVSPWQRSAHGWSAPVKVLRVVQGTTVLIDNSRLWLGLSGDERPPAGGRIRARGRVRFAFPAANGGPMRAPLPRLWAKSRRLIEIHGERRGRVDLVRDAWDRSLDSADARPGLRRRRQGVALARALVLGERGGLGGSFEQGLRRAGLAHLLAISGLHVGILAGAGLLIGRLLSGCLRGRHWSWLVPMLCASIYLLVAGPRPAIVRASLMSVLAWAALARGGRPVRWNTLALVVGAMVLGAPRLLRELSFQLTAAATAGILFVGRSGSEPPPGGRTWAALRVSVAAQVSTLPFALPVFHLLAPAAPLHNLWAVPWIALFLFAALGWTALALVSPRAAAGSAALFELGALPFELIGRAPAGPWWSVPVALSSPRAAGVALVAATALRRPALAMALLTGLALLAGSGRLGGTDSPELSMLDVGQGEALLLRDGGSAALIDGGGWATGDLGGRILVPALARLGVRSLDALVMTHPDVDHCRGLVDVAAYVPVREIWTPAGWAARPCPLDLLSLPGVLWRPLWAGMVRSLGRWRVEVLHPLPGDRTEGNDRSLVLRAEVHGFRALLTGDVERGAELALLGRRPAVGLEADLLKIAHHGSRTSTGPELLGAVAPRLAWISAGRTNRYGHPSPEVLERLRARGVRVLRTDRGGLVRLRISAAGGVRLSRPGAPVWALPETSPRAR